MISTGKVPVIKPRDCLLFKEGLLHECHLCTEFIKVREKSRSLLRGGQTLNIEGGKFDPVNRLAWVDMAERGKKKGNMGGGGKEQKGTGKEKKHQRQERKERKYTGCYNVCCIEPGTSMCDLYAGSGRLTL